MRDCKLISLVLFLSMFVGIGLIATPGNVTAQETTSDNAKDHHDDDDDGDESPKHQKMLAKQAKVTKKQAKTIALERVPGEIIEIEIEKENGKLQWAVDIRGTDGNLYDVEIDAITGEVLQAIQEDDDDGEDGDDDDGDEDGDESPAQQKALATNAQITKAQAIEIALARVPGEVVDVEIEKEKGRLQWAIDIRGRDGKLFDVEIDAMSGEILQAIEEDSEDDDDG